MAVVFTSPDTLLAPACAAPGTPCPRSGKLRSTSTQPSEGLSGLAGGAPLSGWTAQWQLLSRQLKTRRACDASPELELDAG